MDWKVYSDRNGWMTDNFLTLAATRREAEEKAAHYPRAIIENTRTLSTYAKRVSGEWGKA